MQRISNEVYIIFIKTIVPAIVGVSIAIAVKMKRKKVTWLSALTSYVIGIGFAFVFGFYIHERFDDSIATIAIANFALVGERIGYWMVFKLKFDRVLDFFIEYWSGKK